MPLEDLEKAGLLLPRSQWGRKEPETRARKVPLAATGAAAALAAVLMYAGDGSWWTWAGLALFLASLAGFTWISLDAIEPADGAEDAEGP